MFDRAAFLRPIAHRGLHDVKHGIVENTQPAFEAAIAGGYGIECDIRPMQGGHPVVFHDEKLGRLVKSNKAVADLTTADLKSLRHRIGDAPIMTLAGLLELVRGRVPLFVEIKSEWDPPDTRFMANIAAIVSQYKGPLAFLSFDPAVLVAMRKLTPEIPRGIDSGRYTGAGWWLRKIGKARGADLRNLLESGPVDPAFYAYQVDALPTPVTEYARRVADIPVVSWTVRTAKQRRIAEKWSDAMIFEGFTP